MAAPHLYGLEQARIQLPKIVAQANAGAYSVITKHGKPCAAVVPLQALETMEEFQASHKPPQGLLALRGTGKGLWGCSVGQTIVALRGEWDDREPI